VTGARLLDIAPTLLELGGYDVPGSMQGKSLITAAAPGPDLTDDQEKTIKDRLSGLGYI
jgi:arylsulfatase A-like enzyme